MIRNSIQTRSMREWWLRPNRVPFTREFEALVERQLREIDNA